MSTKSLDQLGRTGAFHHILRRQMCMTDTSLFQLEDSRDISDLPLTGDGVFGSKLESTLKSRKEKNKTLDDLLPDFSKSDRKRRAASNDGPKTKKPCLDKDKSEFKEQGENSNFRVPKFGSTGNFQRKGADKSNTKDSGKQTKSDNFHKKGNFSNKGGKANRK